MAETKGEGKLCSAGIVQAAPSALPSLYSGKHIHVSTGIVSHFKHSGMFSYENRLVLPKDAFSVLL